MTIITRLWKRCTCVFAGLLKPGGTVVEGTAGNTGIGLAHICNALGYKCVIFMPNTQSQVESLSLLHNKCPMFFLGEN